jgi:integrase
MGLRWQDVDLVAPSIAIRQTRVQLGYETIVSTPKTQNGRRLVALDPATAAALSELRTRREEESAGEDRTLEPGDIVFTDEQGEPLHPERATRLFHKASKKAGVPEIRLHDLRHSHASLALAAGIHPKVVSERLGHANIGITLDTYSHLLPALSEEAACRVAALVVPGSERE